MMPSSQPDAAPPTTAGTQVLLQYQNIALLSGKMLCLARCDQWADVLGVYGHYAQAIHHLKDLPATNTTNRPQTRRLLRQTLEHDARLRALLNPEVERLAYLLGRGQREKNLRHCYGSSQQVLPH